MATPTSSSSSLWGHSERQWRERRGLLEDFAEEEAEALLPASLPRSPSPRVSVVHAVLVSCALLLCAVAQSRVSWSREACGVVPLRPLQF